MAASRYSRVAIALHWLIAAAIIAMVPMGLWMTAAVEDPERQQAAYRVFQIHKAVGFSILALTVIRLGWRLLHSPPPLPLDMKGWERVAAHAVHAAFYVLLLALPLTGWLYVSFGWSAPLDQPLAVATSFFGLFHIPHLPGLPEASAELRRPLAFHALGAHSLLAWGTVVLFLMHAGAALKHHFLDRDEVLGHMIPWLRSGDMAEAAVPLPTHDSKGLRASASYTAGVALILLVGAVGWFAARPDGPAPPVPDEVGQGPGSAPVAASATPEGAITPGRAAGWAIEQAASSITFAGINAGAAFQGRFEDWEGHVWFDPDDLEGSRAVVLVRTASARTGDATQEGSLRQDEWFDTGTYPVARFEADRFRALGGNRFEAAGTLTVKEQTVPVVLPFSFAPDGENARVEGTVELDRIALGLGLLSDASASWVSRAVEVSITVTARRN